MGGVSSFAFQGTNAHALVSNHLSEAADLQLLGSTSVRSAAGCLAATRYWVLPPAHPLLHCVSLMHSSASQGTVVYECQLLAPRLALYAHHSVFGRVLFPAAGMLEAALAAGASASDGAPSSAVLAVQGMAISAPLVLPPPEAQRGDGLVMRCKLETATGAFALSHAEHRGSKKSIENATGCFVLAAAAAATAAAHTVVAVALQAASLRALFICKAAALLVSSRGHAKGTIVVPSSMAADGYRVPPTCMDACLHLGVTSPGCDAKVPIAIGAFAAMIRAGAPPPSQLEGATTAAHDVSAAGIDISSFSLRGLSGGEFASLADLETKVMKGKSQASGTASTVKAADYLYEVECSSSDTPIPDVSPGTIVGSMANRVAWAAVSLLAAGNSELSLRLGGSPHGASTSLLSVFQAGEVAALSMAQPEVLPVGPAAAQAGDLLTAGALEGLLRVAASEQAQTAFLLTAVDRAATAPAAISARLSASMGSKGILATVRQHGRVATVPRLLRSTVTAPAVELLQVRPMPRGSLASLATQPLEPSNAKLGPRDVLVAVKAVGINFRCGCWL